MIEVKKVFRVLSIDGGGMRGIYSANFLKTLACRFGKMENMILVKSLI